MRKLRLEKLTCLQCSHSKNHNQIKICSTLLESLYSGFTVSFPDHEFTWAHFLISNSLRKAGVQCVQTLLIFSLSSNFSNHSNNKKVKQYIWIQVCVMCIYDRKEYARLIWWVNSQVFILWFGTFLFCSVFSNVLPCHPGWALLHGVAQEPRTRIYPAVYPLECWDCKCMPPCWAWIGIF